MRPILTTLLAAALAAGLAGCGRKGGLEPPGTQDAAPAAPTLLGTSPAAPPPAEPAPREDRPFVLDALI
jgi:predicted small lipoprotein YifL